MIWRQAASVSMYSSRAFEMSVWARSLSWRQVDKAFEMSVWPNSLSWRQVDQAFGPDGKVESLDVTSIWITPNTPTFITKYSYICC